MQGKIKYQETEKTKFQVVRETLAGIKHLKNLSGEDKLNNEIVCNLQILSFQDKLKCVWFHVPNEMWAGHLKNKAVAITTKRKALGMISGAPDLIFLSEGCSFGVELKVGKNKQTESQKNFEQWMKYNNINYFVVKSWQELKSILISAKILV